MSILCSGSFVADILVPDLPEIGPPGSLTYAPNGIHLSPGGHSSNVAINLAQLEATDIYAVGSVGEDEIGDFLIRQLKNRGITPISEKQKNSTTAKNVALLVRGEDRRYIAELTANSLLTEKHLTDSIKKTKPLLFYQGTLGGLPKIEKNLHHILKETKKQGTLNFIDVIMPSTGWNYLDASYPMIDIFHANQLEASNLTKENDPYRAITKINQAGVTLAIITDAQNGVIAGTTKHHITMPAFKVEQIDPTGAGDALSAGILVYLWKNKEQIPNLTDPETITELLLAGQAAGAACVTGLGATTAVTMKNVKNILKQKDQIEKHTRIEPQ